MFIKDGVLHVFYTRAGDKPERILSSKVTIGKDWNDWKAPLSTGGDGSHPRWIGKAQPSHS